MNKEEVLKKSRNENFDERENHIDVESYSYGIIGVVFDKLNLSHFQAV